jgi:hypothetical protein
MADPLGRGKGCGGGVSRLAGYARFFSAMDISSYFVTVCNSNQKIDMWFDTKYPLCRVWL